MHLRRTLKSSLWAAWLSVFIAPSVGAQPGFRAWVGIYAPTRLGWLENENRISEFCGNSTDVSACYSEMLGPAVDVYTLHAEANDSSARIGELIVVAVPGRGLSAHFRRLGARETITFVPDLFLQDWGYGPFFHQTITQRQGDWFQLPRNPWETPVWLHRPSEREQPSVIAVQAGDILELRGAGMYVVAAEAEALLLRSEQPADLWCQEGDPPPLVDEQPMRLSREELVDSNGHLVFRLKYLKGC